MQRSEPLASDNTDRLEKRISRFLADVTVTRSTNGRGAYWLGTSLGKVREQNQDRALIVSVAHGDRPNRNLMLSVLSDGMGGLVRGEEAAIITVCKFVSRIIRKSQQSLPQRMIDAAQQANQAVFDRLGGKGGATLTVVCSSVDGPIGLNVGDSRIYGVDHGHPPVQLSKDDTLAGYLGSAAQGENRNHLVQYIGMGENLEPHIVEIPRRYSTALLSTDGAHGVQASAFSEAIQGAESQATIVRQLIALSDMVANGSRAQLNLRYPKGLRVRWHSKKPIISTGARQ